MNQNRKYDVVVIGRGITGVSSAWHLAKLGYKNVLLIGPNRLPENCASVCPGFITAGTIDNITRISHGHGNELASALLKLGNDGFNGLKEYASAKNIPWDSGEISRFAPTEHEHNEMKQAVDVFRTLGFPATLHLPQAGKDPKATVAIQCDGIKSAATDTNMIFTQLEQDSGVEIANNVVQKVTANAKNTLIETSNASYECEMAVLATHLATGQLIPNLRESLVSFADQWISFETTSTEIPLNSGDFWIGHHGHYAVWKNRTKIFMSGARFLRHWAGIEATTADVRTDVTDHLLKKGQEWFGFQGISNVQAGAILDCRPCDELPIIGPMFGQNRILVGCGYMGAGLALGFAAGRALAEIIHTGRTHHLHPGLSPNRLRSLSS